jgi:hypothetical protein
MSQRAAALAQQSAQLETAALIRTGAALWESFFGNAREARRSAMAALKLSRDREVEYGAAAALAHSGDSSRSQELANDLERRFGEDTSVRFSYLPELHAFLAMNQGKPAKAIELLGVAVPYEFGKPRSSIHGSFGALYPIYVRGEVYLAAHRGVEAVTEFQKILNHRGIVVSDPIGALATCKWAGRSCWQEIRPRLGLPTRISSLSGEMAIPTSQFSGKPRPNTRRSSERRGSGVPFLLLSVKRLSVIKIRSLSRIRPLHWLEPTAGPLILP